jgi:hypothetical protein
MSLKHEKLAENIISMSTQYLLGKISEEMFVENVNQYKAYLDRFKFQEEVEKNKNKPPMPSIDGYALNRLLRESDDDWVFDQELIDYCLEEDEDDWTNFLGWGVKVESAGFHHHDGQIVDYTVYFTSPEGHSYHVNDSHNLVVGWDFDDSIKFY